MKQHLETIYTWLLELHPTALVLPIVREFVSRYRGGPPSGGSESPRGPRAAPDLPPLDETLGRATLALFAVLCLVGCGASTVDYELCRAEVRARFHAAADLCSTPQCIDALSERELADLRGCR